MGAGTRARADTEPTLFQVRDDRLPTGQRVTHGVLRRHFDGDAAPDSAPVLQARTGLQAASFVHARSWSLSWDWPAFFVRPAQDPPAGFNPPTQDRPALGLRF